MIKYNPVTKNGKFEVIGFAGTKNVAAVDEAGAKWKYLEKVYGKEMNGFIYNQYVRNLQVNVIRPTERLYD